MSIYTTSTWAATRPPARGRPRGATWRPSAPPAPATWVSSSFPVQTKGASSTNLQRRSRRLACRTPPRSRSTTSGSGPTKTPRLCTPSSSARHALLILMRHMPRRYFTTGGRKFLRRSTPASAPPPTPPSATRAGWTLGGGGCPTSTPTPWGPTSRTWCGCGPWSRPGACTTSRVTGTRRSRATGRSGTTPGPPRRTGRHWDSTGSRAAATARGLTTPPTWRPARTRTRSLSFWRRCTSGCGRRTSRRRRSGGLSRDGVLRMICSQMFPSQKRCQCPSKQL
mmetsp:Transcript_85970/g.196035  ORF Transcript_85970/g.196035 Transcript_85970/m.196035 type:complete len:281 (-) Transcript_85970:127-969(-)